MSGGHNMQVNLPWMTNRNYQENWKNQIVEKIQKLEKPRKSQPFQKKETLDKGGHNFQFVARIQRKETTPYAQTY